MLFKRAASLSLLILTCMLTACGQEQGGIISKDDLMKPLAGESQTVGEAVVSAEKEASAAVGNTETEEAEASTGVAEVEELQKRFGENCITDQTFEAELSEYDGKVWFVSYEPTVENTEHSMQIVQDDKVLTEVRAYVPEELSGEQFKSLDAVSFYDVNYDNCTDIVTIATYGNKTFAAVYYGFAADAVEYDMYFLSQENLSDRITAEVSELTIPKLRAFLAAGKKNGKFADYREAYEAVVRLCELEDTSDSGYNLIYVDGDGIPELVSGKSGYYVNLYTYHDGRVYTLMNHWGYGAMGNAGYEYCPKENRLRNYNNDYAGAIWYATYMKMNERYSLETVAQIQTFNFDDANGNKKPDENEQASMGYYSKSYMDGKEVTEAECSVWDEGGFEYIEPCMSLADLRAALEDNN